MAIKFYLFSVLGVDEKLKITALDILSFCLLKDLTVTLHNFTTILKVSIFKMYLFSLNTAFGLVTPSNNSSMNLQAFHLHCWLEDIEDTNWDGRGAHHNFLMAMAMLSVLVFCLSLPIPREPLDLKGPIRFSLLIM